MNWGEVKTAVKQYLESEETTFVANLPLFARLAEEDIYRKVQLQFSKDTAQTDLIPGDKVLTLPFDAISVYGLTVISPVYNALLPKDDAFLREAYPNPNTVGLPRYYAFRDEENVTMAPTPGDYYRVELHYYKKPTSISKDDNPLNENWLSKNGENALLFGILMHGYIYEKGDQDVIQMYGKQFEVALQDLKLIAEGRQKKDTFKIPDQKMPT